MSLLSSGQLHFAKHTPNVLVGHVLVLANFDLVWTFVGSPLTSRILLPGMESYMSAGDFTPWHKFISAVKENLILNAIYAVIGTAFVIYLAVRNHLDMYVLYYLY